jgi:hypothetical protein
VSRRNGELDPVFEQLMARLVGLEPRAGYSRLEQIPFLSDDELAAVLDHIADNCPEDFAKLLDADTLGAFATSLRSKILTPLMRNAAMGQTLYPKVQASARAWLVRYADEECVAEQANQTAEDRRDIARAYLPGGDL